MKVFLHLLLVFLIACSGNPAPGETGELQLSLAQKGIQELVGSFRREYKAAYERASRDSIAEKYNQRIHAYLDANLLDSFPVHVDDVVVDDLTITTDFHSGKDIAFKYGRFPFLLYPGPMAPRQLT